MRFRSSICFLLLCCFVMAANGQTNNASNAKKRHKFAFYAGVGPNVYHNNLETARNLVKPWNYAFVGRFMWEPEHFLSLGIESGYNVLYRVDANSQAFGSADVTNVAIPLQVVVSMRFFTNYYFNFAMGQSILLNKASTSGHGDFSASSWSFADFGLSLGYRHRFANRLSVGAEGKLFYSTKYRDANLTLAFVAGYNF